MRKIPTAQGLSALILAIGLMACQDSKEYGQPNIVLILADDLGYGELGCYGQEIIETPNIDRLAASGMLFTQHYSGASVCAPARCVLLTGKHTGHAAIRGNDEMRERGDVWDYMAMYDDPSLEGQRPMPDSETTIGEMLQSVGYTTGFVGKWGLGAPGSEGAPENQGFDYFFGYNCQRQAHTLYPGHLWENDERLYLDNRLLPPHTPLPEGVGKNTAFNYARFAGRQYAPDIMHLKAIDFIETQRANPFLLIYASPLPHLPLQAPSDWVEYYREIIPEDPPYDGSSGYFPNFTPRAAYAGMISTLDEQVGDLIAIVDSLGLLENTVFLFTSDNGPTYTGGADTEYFNSAGPFSEVKGRSKGHLYEGGIRIPLIASWEGHIEKGTKSDHVSSFQDYMPTIAEVAGAQLPGGTDGISFLPTLRGGEQSAHEYLFWEQPENDGQMAVRYGDWKMIIRDMDNGNMTPELYDLRSDLAEQRDVALQNADVIEKMQAMMQQSHVPSPIERFAFPQDE